MWKKKRCCWGQKERGHLGPRGCMLILGGSSKQSNLSWLILLVLLTSGSAQTLQAGNPSCHKALCLHWHSFTHSLPAAIPGPTAPAVTGFPEHLQTSPGTDGVSHMGAEQWTAPVPASGSEQARPAVRVGYYWLIPTRAVLQ